MRASVRVSRSSRAAEVPLALPVATSLALASRMARVFLQGRPDGAQAAVFPGPVGHGHPAGGVAGAVGDGVDRGLDPRRR